MPTYHILYNPLAGNGTGHAKAESLKEVFTEGEHSFHDITKLDINKFISETADDDKIVISGGDGTLSRFVNTIMTIFLKRKFTIMPPEAEMTLQTI